MQSLFAPSHRSRILCASALLATLAGCGGSGDTHAVPPSNPNGSDGGSSTDAPADGCVDCTDGCPAGTIDCGDGCVDTSTDPAHCGACANACAPPEECHASTCGAACDDECPSEGASECFGEGVRQCGEHDGSDLCLEWSAVDPCDSGTVCDPTTVSCREPCGDFCEPFSVVLLPDTQYYTNKQLNNASNTYRKQAQWIIDRRQTDNIQFVIHLGDITNNNYPEQWEVADAAHQMLDDASIPYSVVPGNHDYLVDGEFDRGGSLFDDNFGQDRFAGKSWYGGGYGSGNTSNYAFFEVGPMKFMVVSLEYAPRKDVLCWADDVIASHPEHRVIVATHCYLTHGGQYGLGCPDADYAAVGSSGQSVWEELVSRHSNIFMVVSGHVDDSEYRVQTGNSNNEVHEMLVDYQFEASCTASDPSACTDKCRAGTYTGNGWLRELVFDPRANSVHAETLTVEEGNPDFFPGGDPVLFCSELYNPTDPAADGGNWYSQDPASPDHRFDFAYDMTAPLSYSSDDLGKLAFTDRTVNSVGAGDQLDPKIALSQQGISVLVWEDDSSATDGAGNHDIKARGLAPGGCSAFADILVNTDPAGHQQSPAVAVDANGDFVAVWADDQDDNGVFQIHGRGFAADGTERIPEFAVNTAAAGQQRSPAIAMAPDGRFVVAWEDAPTSSDQAQILVRGFNADGTERFSDRSVHTDALGQRIAPAIGLDANAAFVVAWQDDSDANGTYQIHARGFDASGNERFPRLTVNSVAQGQQRRPSIGVSGAGAFLVAWEDDQDNDGNYDIWARGFGSTGAATVADFRVHAAAGGQHAHPSVSMTPGGAYAMVWQDDADGNGTHQIRARTFHADSSPWMAEWTVNKVPDGQQLSPDIAMSDGGTVVAVWQDDMDGNDSYQLLACGLDSP